MGLWLCVLCVLVCLQEEGDAELGDDEEAVARRKAARCAASSTAKHWSKVTAATSVGHSRRKPACSSSSDGNMFPCKQLDSLPQLLLESCFPFESHYALAFHTNS
jgi:hypothetical protein